MALEMDDDVFYADLSKQIALLIMDDDDAQEFPIQTPPAHLQGFHYMPRTIMPTPYTYEMAYRSRESKGTGVFIPRSSFPRRKNRTGKSNSANNNNNNNNSSQKQLDKSRIAVSRSSDPFTNLGSTKNRT